jgi:hypothetical protein
MSMRRMHGSGRIASFLTTAVLVLALMGGIFGIVWTVSGITSLEYQIGELEERKARALKERKALEAEVSSLLSIRQVDQRGLELIIPDREQVFYVKRSSAAFRHAAERNKE